MPGYTQLAQTERDEMYFLDAPRPAGPKIATYAGTPVAEAVMDRSGHHYTYAGIAPKRRDGRPDVAALRPGEFLVGPGIIYHRDDRQGAADAGAARRSAEPSWLDRLRVSMFHA